MFLRERLGKIKRSAIISMRYESPLTQIFTSLTAPPSARKFTRDNLYFSNEISKVLRREKPRVDKFILSRKPNLEFEHLENFKMVSISQNYTQTDEIRIDNRPYEALCRALSPVFNQGSPTTFLDIGCSSGNLISEVGKSYLRITSKGIDTFQFLKEAAPPSVRESIQIMDLRRKIPENMSPAEIVTCLEIAEHIDPYCLDQFLSNVRKLTGRYLIMSWSSSYPIKDAPPQHLSPLWKWQYKRVMKSRGFHEEKELTRQILELATNETHFHEWWKRSMIVWSV